MDNKILKGLSLILFGILLCLGSGEMNNVVLLGFSYIPFPLFGFISGIIGLLLILGKDKNTENK